MPNEPTYILSIKPAPGFAGPLLVSDDQALIRMVIEAISTTYNPPTRAALRLDVSKKGGRIR